MKIMVFNEVGFWVAVVVVPLAAIIIGWLLSRTEAHDGEPTADTVWHGRTWRDETRSKSLHRDE
ncbi:MAG: hypothetical protein V4532_12995 [Pseudomonadota bacterium]